MNDDKAVTIAVRFTQNERNWLEKEAYENGRTLSGEVRFRLRKLREQENARQETTN